MARYSSPAEMPEGASSAPDRSSDRRRRRQPLLPPRRRDSRRQSSTWLSSREDSFGRTLATAIERERERTNGTARLSV
jgi:hypothetical protein